MAPSLSSCYRFPMSMSLEMIVAIVVVECIVRPEECHVGLMTVILNLTVFSFMCLKV